MTSDQTLNLRVSKSSLVSQLKLDHETDDFKPDHQIFDVNGELVDLKSKNSWVRELDEVSLTEFMEVYVINSTAPFILCS